MAEKTFTACTFSLGNGDLVALISLRFRACLGRAPSVYHTVAMMSQKDGERFARQRLLEAEAKLSACQTYGEIRKPSRQRAKFLRSVVEAIQIDP